MRFTRVEIKNFRAIRSFEIEGLGDMVVIAGPNGCGKSAVFDAMRLLKSAYGGYDPNEWQTWFGEFQISLNRPGDLMKLFRDQERPIEIGATIELSNSESSYIRENVDELLRPLVWRQVLGRDIDSRAAVGLALANEIRTRGPQLKAELERQRAAVLSHLSSGPFFDLSVTVQVSRDVNFTPSPVVDLVFQTYRPSDLGVIDYHGAGRSYHRESLGGVNLNLDAEQDNRRSQSLYNWQNKYQNVKTELASAYVRELVAREANTDLGKSKDLNETLSELFQNFFPNKAYHGPRPTADGRLEFPVHLSTGETHDIDELSSGEKEILYGYLRLRNSAPKQSVILFDEPELHLNPGLLQGLPDFYHKHLGKALSNQLWMVTHSDALLRQAVGNPNFSVFHMRSAFTTQVDENQALKIDAETETERAVIDLVGDLAAYKPQAKVVILEGGGDSEFDVQCLTRLFPNFAQKVNLVSGGSKQRVRDLYDVLTSAAERTGLGSFFAIVDRDASPEVVPSGTSDFTWDRYHIENYLLEPRFILAAVIAVAPTSSLRTEQQVQAALKDCATEVIPRAVLERLQREVNKRLVSAINIGAPRDSRDPAEALLPSLLGSFERLERLREEMAAPSALAALQEQIRAEVSASLQAETWFVELPGRLLLSRFVGRYVPDIGMAAFRNLVLDQMADDGFQPEGMRSIIEQIEAAP